MPERHSRHRSSAGDGPSRVVFILGAGGHGRVVADVAARAFPGSRVVFVDPAFQGQVLQGSRVLPGEEELAAVLAREGQDEVLGVVVAIGDGERRAAVARRYPDFPYLVAVDPSAVVSPSARLGPGTVVMPQAAVNAGAAVDSHVILNTGCTVDHDCRIGSFAHIGPGAHLAGGVTVGQGALIGVGAVAAPGVTIGDGAVVGAGAAVVRDVPPRSVAYGVPARVRRRLP
ncbi:MAG TPA: acetyltransferase [Bacillota bacterium]